MQGGEWGQGSGKCLTMEGLKRIGVPLLGILGWMGGYEQDTGLRYQAMTRYDIFGLWAKMGTKCNAMSCSTRSIDLRSGCA